MKTNFLKISILALVLFTASCSNDDDKNEEVIPAVVTQKFSNLYAPQTGGGQSGTPVGGEFIKFSFSENKIVTNDNWDIAFRGTTIIVNGGVKVSADDADEPARTGSGAVSAVSGAFASVTTFPLATTFTQDAATIYAFSGDNVWYNYDGVTHIISSKAGKIFVVKTHDGKYAKFEILSYYKDAPATPEATSESRYFTFNFAYQANSTTTF
ncbi:HmuY family protein [Flavobacterium sp. 5]|uniref:HmuY family protein n=1 Tax=Flavobacterium sp. 5 TaxID=2035199 RepID=UPI000C2CC027|nr:HmuY family protein [Flavobacterium sp. 5]PKB17533.1 heme-binding HmuY-like protein [Flavobacterium sp. 5]